jgi:hypothetical protein
MLQERDVTLRRLKKVQLEASIQRAQAILRSEAASDLDDAVLDSDFEGMEALDLVEVKVLLHGLSMWPDLGQRHELSITSQRGSAHATNSPPMSVTQTLREGVNGTRAQESTGKRKAAKVLTQGKKRQKCSPPWKSNKSEH